MVPFYAFIGLSPQHIAGIGSVATLGLGGSSLLAMRGKQLVQTRFAWPLSFLTIVSTVLAMAVLPHVESNVFKMVVGVLLVALAPTLFIKKASLQPGARSQKHICIGYTLYGLLLFGAALFGGMLAPLLFLPLMFLLGLNALESTASRRLMGLVQAGVMFAFVLPQGYILWSYALVSFTGCYIGGHMGTKMALKKGSEFVKKGLAVTMIVSGIALLAA